MSVQYAWLVLTRRWFVVVAAMAVGIMGTLAYVRHEQRVYRATVTVVVHPSGQVATAHDLGASTQLLTSSPLLQNFAMLAETRELLVATGQHMAMPASAFEQYSVEAVNPTNTAMLQIAVMGPDARRAARLANALAARFGVRIHDSYLSFTTTTLAAAIVPTSPSRPQLGQAALASSIAGLMVGLVLAVLSFNGRAIRPPGAAPLGLAEGGVPRVPGTYSG